MALESVTTRPTLRGGMRTSRARVKHVSAPSTSWPRLAIIALLLGSPSHLIARSLSHEEDDARARDTDPCRRARYGAVAHRPHDRPVPFRLVRRSALPHDR